MGTEERMNRAAEQLSTIIIDNGFDTDEATEFIENFYLGFVVDDSLDKANGDMKAASADILKKCIRLSKTGMSYLKQYKESNG